MEEKNRVRVFLLSLSLILFFIFMIILVISINPSIIGNIINKINPPDPKVISFNCKQYNAGLFQDTRVKLTGIVKNYGGDGSITILGTMNAEGEKFDFHETRKIYMKAGEIQTITFDFDSSKFREGSCLVTAYADK